MKEFELLQEFSDKYKELIKLFPVILDNMMIGYPTCVIVCSPHLQDQQIEPNTTICIDFDDKTIIFNSEYFS